MSIRLFEVVKAMVGQPQLINEVANPEEIGEYYFKFKDVIFSLLQREESSDFGRYSIYLYPKAKSISQIIDMFAEGDFEKVSMVSLHSNAGANENQYLSSLYKILVEKYLGLDDIYKRLLS